MTLTVTDNNAMTGTATVSINVTPPPHTLCNTQLAIPESECEALAALYDATDGPNWTNQGGWKNYLNPCAWGGVTCTNGHVTSLTRDSNGLSGPVPPEIGDLTNLQSLSLSNNQLTSIPAQIGNLTNLQYLILNDNQLTGIPPEIGDLTNLQYLTLNNNQLSGDISPWLAPLRLNSPSASVPLTPLGGNSCLNVGGDASLKAWLDQSQPGWDACP